MNGGINMLLLQFALIGLVFYFLILRPQSQARKQAAEMLAQIKKGDEITTAGGIVGKVKDVKDTLLTIESGTSTLVIERARVIRVGNQNISGHVVIYASHDPAAGQWEPVTDFAFGDLSNKSVHELCAWGDYLYAGTLNHEGFQLWRSRCEGEPPYEWEQVLTRGAWRGPENQGVLSMCPFKGSLYIGTGIQGGGIDKANKIGPAAAEVIRLNEDLSWDLIVGEPRDTPDGRKEPLSGRHAGFDNFFNGYIWRMCEHEGWLYASTFEWSAWLGYVKQSRWPGAFASLLAYVTPKTMFDNGAGFDLYRSNDGVNWVPVTTNGMGNPYNMGLRTLESTPYGLFLGTANPWGPKVMPLDGDKYVFNPRGGCEVFLGRSPDEDRSRRG